MKLDTVPTVRYSESMTPKSSKQDWLILLLLSLSLFVVGADNSILYTALPALESQLNTTSTEALWIINAYPLLLSGLLLGSGTLGDKIGHRATLLIGLTTFSVASLMASLSPNPEWLIVARAFLGTGAAFLMPSSLALVKTTFHQSEKRHIAIGIWGSASVIGAACGPIIGGLLLEFFWWGSVFLINVPITLLVILGILEFGSPNQPISNKPWDLISSILFLITMVSGIAGIKELARDGSSEKVIGGLFVVSAIFAGIFYHRQRTIEYPLLLFGVFKNRFFTAGAVAAFSAMFVVAGCELMTTQRFQLVRDFSPLDAGLLVSVTAISAGPIAILGGALLARVGYFPLIVGGFAVMTAGASLLLFSFHIGSMAFFVVGLLLVGVGNGSVTSVSSTAIIDSTPSDKTGMGAAVEAVSYEFGTLLAVAILGSLQSYLFTQGEHSMDAFDQAFDYSYSGILLALLCASLVALAITFLCLIPRKGEEAAR